MQIYMGVFKPDVLENKNNVQCTVLTYVPEYIAQYAHIHLLVQYIEMPVTDP